MKKGKIIGLIILGIIVIFIASYFILTKIEKPIENTTLIIEEIYSSLGDFGGFIDECTYEGNKIYSTGENAYDAGNGIFNEEGESIGVCNYAWGKPDSICGDVQNCVTVYVSEDNIWGKPAIDIYNLEKINPQLK